MSKSVHTSPTSCKRRVCFPPGTSCKSAREKLFVTHIIHVAGGIALKLAEAIKRAEIKGFCVMVVTGRSFSNANFHFADRIDRHGFSSSKLGFKEWGEGFLESELGIGAFLNSRSSLLRASHGVWKGVLISLPSTYTSARGARLGDVLG